MKRQAPTFFLRARTYTALFSTWLLNLGMFGIKWRKACAPGFNCHGCPWATCACPIGVMAFSSAMGRLPFFALSSVLLIGALLGRLVCGFACPFGFFQDLLFKIPSRKFRLPPLTRLIKYGALILLVFTFPYFMGFKLSGYILLEKAAVEKTDETMLDLIIPAKNPGTEPVVSPEIIITYKDKKSGKEIDRITKVFSDIRVDPGSSILLPRFSIPDRLSTADISVASPQSLVNQSPFYQYLYFCKLCPNGTLTATIPSYFSSKGSGMYRGQILRIVIFIFFLVLIVLVSRPFCQTFCPLGALYGIICRFSLLRLTIDRESCINCGLCDRACPVNLDVRREVGGTECIACGDCIKVCPKGIIRRKIGM